MPNAGDAGMLLWGLDERHVEIVSMSDSHMTVRLLDEPQRGDEVQVPAGTPFAPDP
jgi:hypothetical protein